MGVHHQYRKSSTEYLSTAIPLGELALVPDLDERRVFVGGRKQLSIGRERSVEDLSDRWLSPELRSSRSFRL